MLKKLYCSLGFLTLSLFPLHGEGAPVTTPPPLKKVYITKGYMNDLFPVSNPEEIPDNTPEFMQKLYKVAAQQGYQLIQANSGAEVEGDFDYFIVFEVFPEQLATLNHIPSEKLILFLWEPPAVLPQNYNPFHHKRFSKVYTWDDSLVDNEKYFKYYYTNYKPMIAERPDFASKKLSTLISAHKYSTHPDELYGERRKVILFFEQLDTDDFDLFGRWWPTTLKTYKGAIESKLDHLKHYKFCFSYENIKNIPGYVTEKMFDCFEAGVVPIYWGASNIEEYVPKNCYISREDFSDQAELYSFIKNMSEEQHSEYITHIQRYLESEKAQLFSIDHFITIFMNLITTQPNARN